jgi:hypothetical protein
MLSASYEELHRFADELLISIFSELESTSNLFSSDSEEKLSAEIAGRVNAHWLFKATNEQNSRGHVDITIRSVSADPHKFTYLGEAKIWDGSKYGVDGFHQLQGYFTGRQKNAFMVFYFQSKSCDELFKKYVEKIVTDVGGKCLTVEQRKAVTEHVHPSTAIVCIYHHAVHLPPPEPTKQK